MHPEPTKNKLSRTDPIIRLRVYLLADLEPCSPDVRAARELNKARSKVANVRCNGAWAAGPTEIRDGEGITGSAVIGRGFCSEPVGALSTFPAVVIVGVGL